MPTQGPTYTGTGANFNDGGTTAWTTPTNIQGDVTATSADCNISVNGGTSQRLRCSNFGFTIPSGNVIAGVMVEVEQSANTTNRHFWNSVKLLVGGTEVGTDQSDGSVITTTKQFKTFGSGSNLWGLTPTLAEVNDSGFGVSLKITRTGNGTITKLYRCRITITYQSESSDLTLVVSEVSHAHAVDAIVLDTPDAVVITPSAFITASGDNTTARLTAPSPKTTGDFQAGRIVDDENPSDAINLTAGKYTEVAYVIKFTTGASGEYEFRLTDNGTELTAYTEVPVVTVSELVTLVVSSVTHEHTAGTVDLVQQQLLAVADAAHAHTSDNVTISPDTPGEATLSVQDADHAHTADSVLLTQQHLLAVADAAHAHPSGSVDLTQAFVITVADAAHAHTVETITLDQSYLLAVSDVTHVHTVENVTTDQSYLLVVSDVTHVHTAGTVDLVVASVLAVDNAHHGHTVETISFFTLGVDGYVVAYDTPTNSLVMTELSSYVMTQDVQANVLELA